MTTLPLNMTLMIDPLFLSLIINSVFAWSQCTCIRPTFETGTEDSLIQRFEAMVGLPLARMRCEIRCEQCTACVGVDAGLKLWVRQRKLLADSSILLLSLIKRSR